MRMDKALKVNNFLSNFSLHQRRRSLTFIIRKLRDIIRMAYSGVMERVTVKPTMSEISLRIIILLMQVHSNFEYSLCFRHILVE
jgi:hypothetical protein